MESISSVILIMTKISALLGRQIFHGAAQPVHNFIYFLSSKHFVVTKPQRLNTTSIHHRPTFAILGVAVSRVII